jgi:signal transduction histidine kinase
MSLPVDLLSDTSVQLLRNTNEKLLSRLVSLETQVSVLQHALGEEKTKAVSLEDERDELQEALGEAKHVALSLREQALAAETLSLCVTQLLSWTERPPSGMSDYVYSEVASRLRSDVEEALRSV